MNDTPHISIMPDVIFPEDSSAVADLDTSVSDQDNIPGELKWMVSVLDTVAVPGGTPPDSLCQIIITIDDTSHKVLFRAMPDYFGIHEVVFTVTDPDGGSDSDTLTVTVSPVNDAPRFLSDLSPVYLEQGKKYALPVTALYPLVEDIDNPDSTLLWSIEDNEHFNPEVADGLIRLTAPLDWFGTDTVTVVVSDGAMSDSGSIDVTVTKLEDIIPPSPPQNLTATAGEKSIALSWNSNTEPDIQAYLLYRGTDSTAVTEAGLIAVLDHPVHAFDDSTAEQGTVYYYCVTATDTAGNESGRSTFAQAFIPIESLVEKTGETPAEFSLSQNYPNPFNPSTRIEFGIPERTQVSLTVFDLLGRKVAELVNEVKQPGVYAMEWDASNMESGIYFIRIRTAKFHMVRKCMMVK